MKVVAKRPYKIWFSGAAMIETLWEWLSNIRNYILTVAMLPCGKEVRPCPLKHPGGCQTSVEDVTVC